MDDQPGTGSPKQPCGHGQVGVTGITAQCVDVFIVPVTSGSLTHLTTLTSAGQRRTERIVFLEWTQSCLHELPSKSVYVDSRLLLFRE